MKERAYNFSAGPSMLPEEVIRDVADNLLNYHECGESVMEMSHRSAEFKAILAEAEADLRDIMNIPDNYKVLFIQGGGTLQFAMVPLNLAVNTRKIDFILTGNWAKKAYKEAVKMGYDTKVVASSEEDTFTYIPEVKKEDFRPDADYVHICYNNTIYGTHYPARSRHVIMHPLRGDRRYQVRNDLGRRSEEHRSFRRSDRNRERRSDRQGGRGHPDIP